MSEIYMIGTNHFCINGPRRLKSKLEEISPDIVLVEGSIAKTKARNYLNGFIGGFLISYGIFLDVAREVREKQKRLGYETKLSSIYCEENESEFGYLKDRLEIPSLGKLRIDARKEIQDLIKNRVDVRRFKEFIEKRQREIDSDWDYLKKYVGTDLEKSSAEMTNEIRNKDKNLLLERDKKMCETLNEYAKDNKDSKIITVTGFSHLLDDPKGRNFYNLVSDLNPQRIFLWSD